MGIKRRVVKADTSGQLQLPIEGEEDPRRLKPCASTTRVFVEPDPERMQIGLKEHLQLSGAGEAFEIDKILRAQDWSVFESAYAKTGRAPYAPRAMVALILYGVMQGKTSLRDLELLARDSLSCLWLTGGIMPDHSMIGRFINRHSSVLSVEFFEELTAYVLRYTDSDVSVTAGDGTVVEAAASRYKTIRREALEKRIEKEQQRVDDDTDDDPKEKKRRQARLDKLVAAEEQLSEREAKRKAKGKKSEGIQINPEDLDAVNQPLKRQGYGIGYRPGVLVNEQRVIVGYGVDATSETRVAVESLAQASEMGRMQESIWDAGYSNAEMLLQEAEYGVELLIPEGQHGLLRKNHSNKYPKSQFVYNSESDEYRCPAGSLLTKRASYPATDSKQAYSRYGTSDCRDCKLRERCTTRKTGRYIERYEHDHLREAMREKMQNESNQEKYKQRAALAEPVFSHLQMQQGLTRFRRTGQDKVRLEFGLHVLANNLSRAVAYWRRTVKLLPCIALRQLLLSFIRRLLSYFVIIRLRFPCSMRAAVSG